MFVDLLKRLQPVRALPTPLRWLLSALIVLLFFSIRYALDVALGAYPYLLFFPAILIASFVFDRGSGFVAVALSTLLATYFFVTPRGDFAQGDVGEVLAVATFVLVGGLLAAIIEALRHTVEELTNTNEALEAERAEVRRSHALLDEVMNGVADAIFVKDREGRYVHVNAALCRLFGSRPAAIVGRTDRDFLPADEADEIERVDREVIASGKIQLIENTLDVVTNNRRAKRVYLFTIAPWFDAGGTLVGVLGTARDVTERRVAEDALRLSNEQKKLLLEDINHRVKNHLQSLSGILSVSEQRATSLAEAKNAMAATASRLAVLGRVYDRLHLTGEAATVGTADFLGGLCSDLSASLVGVRPVTLSCSVEQVELDANQAVSVGLIVNELLQNSLKHAFPGNTAGEVAVRLARVANDLVLEVADTGAGAREVRENGTGQRLVRALAQQLGGSAKWDGPPGTRVTVRFPAPRREQGAARPNLTVVPSTVAH